MKQKKTNRRITRKKKKIVKKVVDGKQDKQDKQDFIKQQNRQNNQMLMAMLKQGKTLHDKQHRWDIAKKGFGFAKKGLEKAKQIAEKGIGRAKQQLKKIRQKQKVVVDDLSKASSKFNKDKNYLSQLLKNQSVVNKVMHAFKRLY